VWESHEGFLVRTDTAVDHPDYHETGLDAFAEYGLQFFTTSEQYYFYSPERESLTPEDLFCHLLLIGNDSRHRKYAPLLAVKTELSPERLNAVADKHGSSVSLRACSKTVVDEVHTRPILIQTLDASRISFAKVSCL